MYVCRRISGLGTDEDCFNGHCDWVDPPDARPDELSDEMAIDCSSVRLGPGWWQDMYFGWYFVYDPLLVARSLGGDHSWVESILKSAKGGQGQPMAEADRDRYPGCAGVSVLAGGPGSLAVAFDLFLRTPVWRRNAGQPCCG